jgi:hypothetical protein
MRRVVMSALFLSTLATCERDSRLAKASAKGHDASIVETAEVSKESGGGEFGPKCARVVEYRHVELRVDRFSRDITTECGRGSKVDLVAAPDGARFAYRIQGGPWRPVWLGKHDVIFAADKGRLAMPEVDWSQVPVLSVAAKDLFRDAKHERERIIAELSQAELKEVLRHSLDAEGVLDDAWSKGFRSLSADQKDELKNVIAGRIVAGDQNANVLLRYAGEVGIRSEKERSAVLRTLSSIHTHALTLGAKERLVVQAARTNLPATADWCCRELERHEPDAFFHPTELFWVMAKAGHACVAALPQLRLSKPKSCGPPPAAIEETIEIALGKLAGDAAHEKSRYIQNEEALTVFAARTLSEEARRELCGAGRPH